jgi:hypothetical protein
MFSFCVHELRLSEEAAYKRIHAARAARRFPAIFPALADGRLHLTAVVLLAPHLTEATATDLLKAAEHKTKSEIEKLLAERFPRPDLPTKLEVISTGFSAQHAPGRVGLPPEHAPERVENGTGPARPLEESRRQEASEDKVARSYSGSESRIAGVSAFVMSPAPSTGSVPPAARPRLAPLAPQRFGLQVTIDQATSDQLRYAQALLSHRIPSGDLAQVLARLVQLGVAQLEKGKFAATDRPREAGEGSAPSARYIPAPVKRAVWKRDGGQCAYVSASGQRCPAREQIEFDHLDPVCLGGEATVNGVQLKCRAHNLQAAERLLGRELIQRKQDAAREKAKRRRAGGS